MPELPEAPQDPLSLVEDAEPPVEPPIDAPPVEPPPVGPPGGPVKSLPADSGDITGAIPAASEPALPASPALPPADDRLDDASASVAGQSVEVSAPPQR